MTKQAAVTSAERDAEDRGAPGPQVDGTERLLAVAVVVMAMIVAVVVGRVVGDRICVAGDIAWRVDRRSSRAFSQT